MPHGLLAVQISTIKGVKQAIKLSMYVCMAVCIAEASKIPAWIKVDMPEATVCDKTCVANFTRMLEKVGK